MFPFNITFLWDWISSYDVITTLPTGTVMSSTDGQTKWSPPPEKPPPTFPFPPPRGRARSGQTVFSLFCQQSFLKEIFFQRNCFCLILYGCLGTLALSLFLCLSLCLSILFSSCSVERSSRSFTLTLTSWGFVFSFILFFFTFCKLKEKQTKKHTKRTL